MWVAREDAPTEVCRLGRLLGRTRGQGLADRFGEKHGTLYREGGN